MAGTSQAMQGPSPVFDTQPTNTPDQFSFKSATFEEVLEELSSRFILNLPEDELAEVERVCFQVEQAHWYYEDFIREAKPSLPSLPLKRFSEILFHSCPLLHRWSHDHETAFNGFMNYKTRVPVCGAIMLNEALTKCVLVKGWKSSAGWGFPKGKVNENEDEALCAVREVAEETGYNLSGQIQERDCIRLCIKQQPITLFVVPAVPEDFPFKTQTRKEISKIDWFKLADLPTWKKNAPSTNKFYLITPVIGPLKSIVRNLRRERKSAKHSQQSEVTKTISLLGVNDHLTIEEPLAIVTVGSPTTLDSSFRRRSGEAEVSSSQSSSIDPHTPSVNGDLVPHTSNGILVIKSDLSTETPDIALDTDLGSVSADLPSHNVDPRSHWSRLMTRLNNSENNSPQETPQAVTPTPPTTSKPIKPELLHVSPPHHTGATNEISPVGPAGLEHPGVNISQKTLARYSNVVARPSSVFSVSPFHLQTPIVIPQAEACVLSADASPSDALIKRTKQLQLLDSVLAEQSTKPTRPQPPMSAHTFGAYPHTSKGLFPGQLRVPIRPASVNLDAPRTLSTPLHHSQPQNAPNPPLPGVLPALAPASSSHQASQSYLSELPLPRNLVSTTGRLPTSLHSQFSFSSYPSAHRPPNGGNAIEAAHRGQMLSILSGERSALRCSNIGAGFRPGSAIHDTGAISRPPSHRSLSSTITVSSAPRSANAHLLSILNNSSIVGRATSSPVPVSVQTRQ